MSPIHRGGHNYSGSKPRAREAVKLSSLFDIKATFDEKDKKAQGQLAKSLATLFDQASRVNQPVGKKVRTVLVDDVVE